jgi:hypothetical protein
LPNLSTAARAGDCAFGTLPLTGQNNVATHHERMEPNEVDESNAVIEALAAYYNQSCLELLERIRQHLRDDIAFDEKGPYAEVLDDFRWLLHGRRVYDGMGVTVMIILAESAQYDGENEYGINWRLEVTEEHGRELIGWSPFNYTENVWVDAREALRVQERFVYFAAIDLENLANTILAQPA